MVRLKPERFYDLMVQVAIVWPGPIQGGMVHPYLRRRAGGEAIDYPSEDIKTATERTLGIPLFQRDSLLLNADTRISDLQSSSRNATGSVYQYPSTFHHAPPTSAKISSSTTHITNPTRHQLPIVTKPLPKMIGEVPVA